MAAVLEKIKIDNINIPIVFEEDKNLPIISMQLIFTASGSMEDEKKQGLARFSAQILNEGTKKLGSIKFAQELEQKAISFHASTGAETLVLELDTLKENLDFAVDCVCSILKDPNLSSEAFENVKQVTLGRIASNENNFDYLALSKLNQLLFKDSPLGHDFLGDVKSIENLSLKDISSFLSIHLNKNNFLLVLGGDLSKSQALKIAQKFLKILPNTKAREITYCETSNKKESSIIIKQTQQAYIYFGSPLNLKVNSKDIHIAKVASYILAQGGFGSRFMEEIRVKRGLAYSTYGKFEVNLSNSCFKGYLQTKNSNLDKAQKLIKKVISNFLKKGVTRDELQKAKQFILGSEPLSNETLHKRLAKAYLETYKGMKLGHQKEELKKIEKLTLEELNTFIKTHEEILNLSFSIVKERDDNI